MDDIKILSGLEQFINSFGVIESDEILKNRINNIKIKRDEILIQIP